MTIGIKIRANTFPSTPYLNSALKSSTWPGGRIISKPLLTGESLLPTCSSLAKHIRELFLSPKLFCGAERQRSCTVHGERNPSPGKSSTGRFSSKQMNAAACPEPPSWSTSTNQRLCLRCRACPGAPDKRRTSCSAPPALSPGSSSTHSPRWPEQPWLLITATAPTQPAHSAQLNAAI